MQRGEREFSGFRHLKRIDETNTTPQRFKWLWDHICVCEEAFDDFTRGRPEFFIDRFQNPDYEFYEVGDAGLVILSDVIERGTCEVHYLTWNREMGMSGQKSVARELLDYVFFERKVHHVVGFIASVNAVAVRFALSVGMKFEGEIRERFLFRDRYYSMHIYGMLDREYVNVRGRLS